MSRQATLILTALLDRHGFAHFEALRQAHFPPERNVVPAHLTLFHHLPGGQAHAIEDRLRMVARGTRPVSVRVAGVRNLGRGVAYRLESAELEDVREVLRGGWGLWLIPQDQQRWSPHITVQNKVEPPAARQLYQQLASGFAPWSFMVEGLSLWIYRDGPWEKLRDFRFR